LQTCEALKYLHNRQIVSGNISIETIIFLSESNLVKLSNYGLNLITQNGSLVDFCTLSLSKYIPPSYLNDRVINLATDYFQLGLLVLEIYNRQAFPDMDLHLTFASLITFEKWIKTYFKTRKAEKHEDVPYLKILVDAFLKLKMEQQEFVLTCLTSDTIDPIINHPWLVNNQPSSLYKSKLVKSQYSLIPKDLSSHPLNNISLASVNLFWKMTGGNPVTEFKKRELLKLSPSIDLLPVYHSNSKSWSLYEDRGNLYNHIEIIISLDNLQERIKRGLVVHEKEIYMDHNYLGDVSDDIDFSALNHKVTDEEKIPEIFTVFSLTLEENKAIQTIHNRLTKLPLRVREQDIDYQYHRVLLFRRLFKLFPESIGEIKNQSKLDVPPFFRGKIWATLLDIKEPLQIDVNIDDVNSLSSEEKTTFRQIDLDVPRCHQYHALLGTPKGQEKLKKLLKTWVLYNKDLSYWQGLDSVAAPFVALHFHDDNMAFSCLQKFIPKYLKNIFLVDNSSILQENLAIFKQIISFHDPELGYHMQNIGFLPDLFAIPWLLTLYSHVFPLDKVFHLWDR
jgi:TBC domain-containing protein kinase-like protein